MLNPESYIAARWQGPGRAAQLIESPVTGDAIARAGSEGLDMGAALDFAHRGGAALRAMNIHDRARMVKALAGHLTERKEELYALNPLTGATRKDGWIDIEGGIVTMATMASKARREMPDGMVHLDGGVERLSRGGTFLGRHVAVPLRGVAVQINAFNFPVWGMLEKLAPALLAGMPAIVKPATQTSYLAEAAFRMILNSGLLPEGAVQLIVGGVGDLLSRLGPQDVLGFTGSAATAQRIRAALAPGVRFVAEQDSLNAAVLGPDAGPDTPEFAQFVKEAAAEITVKAGQKCTAMRRLIVPQDRVAAVVAALSDRLAKLQPGDPADPATRMGALVSRAQRDDVLAAATRIGAEAKRVFGADRADGVPVAGAFLPPQLYLCDDPDAAQAVHAVEAFGPLATILPARDMAHAAALANRGGGSLVSSLFTHDPDVARAYVLEAGAWHGRVYIADRDAAGEATGHGSPLPHMIHGGPGRAGGGEELGGVRGILHHSNVIFYVIKSSI